MLIAEVAITPVGEGRSERAHVEAAVQAMRRAGVQPRVGPFATAFEARDLAHAFEVVQRAHQAAMDQGAQRVLLELRVDDRRDKRRSLQEAQRIPA